MARRRPRTSCILGIQNGSSCVPTGLTEYALYVPIDTLSAGLGAIATRPPDA